LGGSSTIGVRSTGGGGGGGLTGCLGWSSGMLSCWLTAWMSARALAADAPLGLVASASTASCFASA